MDVAFPNITLEIHHIDVSGGDCAVIVLKGPLPAQTILYKVMIDAGGVKGGLPRLSGYLNAQGWRDTPFDLVIASHFHDDHIAGFEACKIPFKKYVDMGGYSGSGFIPCNKIQKSYEKRFVAAYRAHIAEQKDAARIRIEFLDDESMGPYGPLVIQPLPDVPLTLTCYMAGGMLANGTNVLHKQRSISLKTDPNDMSLAWLLEWGEFRYFTAGDLSGDPFCTHYYNLEKPLADYLCESGGPLAGKQVSVMKVNHHGSEYSTYPQAGTDAGFLERLCPDVLVVQSNVMKRVPSASFLDRASRYSKTNEAAVVFVNDFMFAIGSNEFLALKALAENPKSESNLELVDIGEGASYVVRDTPAVVVRRKTGGLSFNDNFEDGAKVIPRDGFEIVLRKGKGATGDVQYRAMYVWSIPIDKNLKDDIDGGFTAEAADIAEWWSKDREQEKTEDRHGEQFLEYWLPSLVVPYTNPLNTTAEEVKAAVLGLMKQLFNTTLELKGATYLRSRRTA